MEVRILCWAIRISPVFAARTGIGFFPAKSTTSFEVMATAPDLAAMMSASWPRNCPLAGMLYWNSSVVQWCSSHFTTSSATRLSNGHSFTSMSSSVCLTRAASQPAPSHA